MYDFHLTTKLNTDDKYTNNNSKWGLHIIIIKQKKKNKYKY